MNRLIVTFLGILSFLVVTLGVVEALPALYSGTLQPVVGLHPYTSEQLQGRQVYISQGCVYCHTQQVRPLQIDTHFLHGTRPSIPGDYAYDQPHLMGTERIGPDLHNIGREHSSPKGREKLREILRNPRKEDPGIIMPSFNYLSDEEIDYLVSYLAYLGTWKEPYSGSLTQWQPHYWNADLNEGVRNNVIVWPVLVGIAIVMLLVFCGILWFWRRDHHFDVEEPAYRMITQEE